MFGREHGRNYHNFFAGPWCPVGYSCDPTTLNSQPLFSALLFNSRLAYQSGFFFLLGTASLLRHWSIWGTKHMTMDIFRSLSTWRLPCTRLWCIWTSNTNGSDVAIAYNLDWNMKNSQSTNSTFALHSHRWLAKDPIQPIFKSKNDLCDGRDIELMGTVRMIVCQDMRNVERHIWWGRVYWRRNIVICIGQTHVSVRAWNESDWDVAFVLSVLLRVYRRWCCQLPIENFILYIKYISLAETAVCQL